MCLVHSFSDFFIVKCSNQCREKAHFHCCFCEKTVINKSQLMTHILSHHEPCVEPGVTSDMHIENVMNKDTGYWILKVERFCDTAKRQESTSTTSASSNRGQTSWQKQNVTYLFGIILSMLSDLFYLVISLLLYKDLFQTWRPKT